MEVTGYVVIAFSDEGLFSQYHVSTWPYALYQREYYLYKDKVTDVIIYSVKEEIFVDLYTKPAIELRLGSHLSANNPCLAIRVYRVDRYASYTILPTITLAKQTLKAESDLSMGFVYSLGKQCVVDSVKYDGILTGYIAVVMYDTYACCIPRKTLSEAKEECNKQDIMDAFIYDVDNAEIISNVESNDELDAIELTEEQMNKIFNSIPSYARHRYGTAKEEIVKQFYLKHKDFMEGVL